jgi:uncharacterized protein with PIN domain
MNRSEVVNKARAKYINTGITLNITEALRMYLENDATPEEQIPLVITTPVNHQIKKELENIRPTCDECNGNLFMQVGATDFVNGQIYPTAWVCHKCNKIEYSDKTPEQWLEILKNENRQ